jgi:hypothetical protein
MQLRLHLTMAALLAVVVLTGTSPAGEYIYGDSRAAVIGRQKIRAELAEAMQEGHLTRRDQYRILLHAKEVLPPEDLAGLERTLDRLASKNSRARARHSADGAMILPSDPTVRGATAPIVALKYEDPDQSKPVSAPMPMAEEPLPESPPQLMGDPEDCCPAPCDECCAPRCCRPRCYPLANLSFMTAVDAFKDPLDSGGLGLGEINGNFGVRLGGNAGMPLVPSLGIGVQAGTNVVLSDFKGTFFTDSTERAQAFTSVGIFQRISKGYEGNLNWGFTYDWLFDDYFMPVQMGQWRMLLSWEINHWNEIGVWGAIRDHGYTNDIFQLHYEPVNQGNLFWRHTWCNNANITLQLGLPERPGFIFGGCGRIPISPRLAATGEFTYLLPSGRGGPDGQGKENWNLSVGLEFVVGGFSRGPDTRFNPLLPVAHNGSFLIRQLD